MDKRKALSKARIVKSKIDPKKGKIEEVHSSSASRLTKLTQLSELSKKNITPTGQRSFKSKLASKRIETPTPKLEDFDQKFILTQDPGDSQYISLINSLMEKINSQKTKRQELEMKLKNTEMDFRSKELELKSEFEDISQENKMIKKEKLVQESKLMEENFLIRREHEDCKVFINNKVNEIVSFLKSANFYENRAAVEDLLTKVSDLIPLENTQSLKIDLKDTASFSYMEPEIVTPPAAVSNGFVEAIALHEHKADNEDEINLSPGDRVMVFNNDETNGWWVGKVRGEIGRFPKTCVMLD